MPVSVVVGGQFGSEGKGKVAHWLARDLKASAVVRVGGSNSGHTVVSDAGHPVIFRHLPTAAILPETRCVLAAGSYLDLSVLKQEIAVSRIGADRLVIDPNAMIVTESDRSRENLLRNRIGSTGTGTGSAVLRRISRRESTILARHCPTLYPYLGHATSLLRSLLANGARVIIEGTQGFGLSVLHSPYYPYVTSRDTTAAGFVSEAGLSPRDVDDIVLVIRVHPIRVAGLSGPLPNEIDWPTVTHARGGTEQIREFTSVSRRPRRVGSFDPEIVQEAIAANDPTRIVLNHVDYVDSDARSGRLSAKVTDTIAGIERGIGRTIDFLGVSPGTLLARAELSGQTLAEISVGTPA